MVERTATDILICTETHIDPSIKNCELLPPEFSQVSRKDRVDSGGGGTLIAVRDSIMTVPLDDLNDNWKNKA